MSDPYAAIERAIVWQLADSMPEETARQLVSELLAGAERRGAERAWQEGRESVAVDMMRPSVDGFKAATPNPYRAGDDQ